MKKLLRLSCFLTFVLACASLAGTASAQWTAIPQIFDGQIHIVKFLDALTPGMGNEGFVGDDTGIWYTNNTGTTWTRAAITSANVPITPFPSGWVNDITFENGGVNGFAIITGCSNRSDSGILVTTNSGATWTFDDAAGTPDSGRGIYYNNNLGWLFVASADKGLVVSKDQGATWAVMDTSKHYTGFAFNGNGFGVLASEGTVCNQGQSTYTWITTTDGGQHWQPSHMINQSWQPVGIQTTETFFASTGDFCSPIAQSILRSDNAGFGFAPVTGYTNGSNDVLNESMAGDGCALFAASADSINGMWYSRNDGNTWVPLGTGTPLPHPPVDTRFYASHTTVWSFTTDTLDTISRPLSGDIHIWPDTIAFKTAACMTTSDTVVHIFGCNCQNNPELTGVTVNHETTIKDTIKAVVNPPIPPPHSLCSAGVGVPDSVTIEIQPTSSSGDSANFQVAFSDNGTTVDTNLHVSINGIKAALTLLGGSGSGVSTVSISTPACGSVDTCLEFYNTSCDTLILSNCTSNETSADACQLQLLGCCDIGNTQGVEILPGYPFNFCIHYDAGLRRGTSNANFQINWRTISGDTSGQTQPVTIYASTTTDVKPSFHSVNINAKNCCDVPDSELVYFLNTTCDTILLYSPILSGPEACAKNFTIDSTGKIPIHFPVLLPPNQHAPITINLACETGTCEVIITFRYSITANFPPSSDCPIGSNCSAYAFDTLADTLTLTSGGPITSPTISPSPRLNFGNVSCCDSNEVRTVTVTAGCRPATITAMAFDTAGDFFLTPPYPTFPIDLAGGGTEIVNVGFRPRCGSGNPGTDTISFTLSDGTKLSTQIVASGTNEPTTSPSLATIAFDSLNICASSVCDTVTLTNNSCGNITLSVLTGPTNPDFTISGLTTNSIPLGGTAQVIVCLNPAASNQTGAITDVAYLKVSGAGGSSTDTLSLSAFINPPVPGYTVTPLATDTICFGSDTNVSFTFTNIGTCYTYTITGGSTGNGQVTVTPTGGTFPVTVATGASQAFTVTFTPTSVGTASGWIVLTNADGSTDTVPYDFVAKNCTVTGMLTLTTSGTTITTPNCTTGTMTFTVGAGGGTGSVIGVSVIGSARFTPNPPTQSGAMPFTGGITFDPNQTGPNSALVTITYTINGGPQTTDTFSVYGIINGVKDSARIGVVNITSGCISPNDTALDTIAVMLRDAIPDSLQATQLSFIIHYNGNLLFDPKGFNLAPGWTISSMMDEVDGLHITLTYSGNPPSNQTAANTPLLYITQLAAIGDSVTSTAVLIDAHFNDSMFEACTLKALSSSGDSASICIDTSLCGGGLLYKAVNGTLQPVTGIQVIPNPVHKDGSAASLHFTTNVSGVVSADVLDELGHSVVTLNGGAMQPGDHAIAIPTDNIPEGAYFTRISVGGVTVIRKFVLEKE